MTTETQPLQTEYKFITFSPGHLKGNPVWNCRNKRSSSQLGYVAWYHPWNQYCYFPAEPAVYSTGCLNDINHFISQLKHETSRPGR